MKSSVVPDHLRRKRFWTVADFATFAGLSHRRARRRLKAYDRQLGGGLLIPSEGTNREYTFLPALLAKAISDGRLSEANGLFDPVESIEMRVDHLEDLVGDLHQAHRAIAAQTGNNTREIAKMRARRHAA